MARIFRKPSSIKLPQRDREAQREEYGREGAGISECPDCGNVKFRKRWYRSASAVKSHLKNPPLKIKVSRKERCPACTMIKERVFEGEVFIDDFLKEHRKVLLNLIKNFEKEALKRDPQDRIITLEKTQAGWRITTTENQLADRLAKKIKGAFNTVKISFSHSKEPFEVDRVHVVFGVK
ncbi:MAG: hypothetical protein HYT69_00650 [Candidatus Zambryskibacteria bacterium]|nr:hypothetical protein [Candidatus Zambryskibacteria bacterium]